MIWETDRRRCFCFYGIADGAREGARKKCTNSRVEGFPENDRIGILL